MERKGCRSFERGLDYIARTAKRFGHARADALSLRARRDSLYSASKQGLAKELISSRPTRLSCLQKNHPGSILLVDVLASCPNIDQGVVYAYSLHD